MSSGHHKQLLLDASLAAKKEAYEKTIATLSSTALLKHQGDITLKDVILAPQEILALFASTKQQDKGSIFCVKKVGEIYSLKQISPHGKNGITHIRQLCMHNQKSM